ncbi:hypothetical protein RU639_013759 [Aspergillus parasiticus]
MTLLDHPQHKSHGTSAMGKHQRSSSCRKGKKRSLEQSLILDSIQRAPTPWSSTSKFTKEQLEKQLLKTITCLRLPFQIVEDSEFQRLLNLIYSGPQGLEFPSAKTLRRRLHDAVTAQQESQLKDLPEDAKVSLALDCWTSPFQQAFMAITVYFIDREWNYRELLLGFEPLHGPHSGVNLSDVLVQLLRERQLLNRIFSVTTNNATNNKTLIRALQESLLSAGAIRSRESIIRIPCMAHVIQLCLKQLLGHIKASPQNEEVGSVWSDSQMSSLRSSADHGGVAHTLAKIRQKLKEYYEKTYRDHGFLYGTGTLLAPQYKLCAFDDTEYSKCQSETSKRYCDYLRNCFAQYQRETPEMSFRASRSSYPQQASELDRLLIPPNISQSSIRYDYNEVDRYLREGIVQLPPRAYWKEHEHDYPVLSRLARDLLSVPATGAGVERLFNSARDICHYRRGSLNESTIQDLMMYRCSEKFNLDTEQLGRLEKPPLEGVDQETVEEEEAIRISEEDFDPISDDEEDTVEQNSALLAADEETSRECMMSDVSSMYDIQEQEDEDKEEKEEQEQEREDVDDALLPPPIQQLRDRSQKRSSGRVTVPSSRLQGYELY